MWLDPRSSSYVTAYMTYEPVYMYRISPDTDSYRFLVLQ